MGLRTKKGSPFALFVILLALVALVFTLFDLKYYEGGYISGGEKDEIYSEWSDFEFISEWDVNKTLGVWDYLLIGRYNMKEALEGTTTTKLAAVSMLAAIAAAFFLLVAGGLWSGSIVSTHDGKFAVLFKPYALIWAPCLSVSKGFLTRWLGLPRF